jgi:hypothetical protein
MATEHVCEAIGKLEDFATQPENPLDGGVPLSFVHGVRLDTYEMRHDYHVGIPNTRDIFMGRVDHRIVVSQSSTRFVDSVTNNADELENEIVVDRTATYSIPIPSVVVPGIATDIAGAASDGFVDTDSAKHGVKTIIVPLAGDSLRRIKRFQARIARSLPVEQRARARENVSNYDVLRGLVSGEPGASEGIEDPRGIGEWFPRHERDFARYLHSGFVLGTLSNRPDNSHNVKDLKSDAADLQLGDVRETITRLVRFAYVGRAMKDGSFKYTSETLAALLDIITHPAYVDLTAIRLFGGPEETQSGIRVTLPGDARSAFSNSLQFIKEIRKQEKNWVLKMQEHVEGSPARKQRIRDRLDDVRVPVVSEKIRSAYVERLQSLSSNPDISDEIRSAATEMAGEYLELGSLQEEAMWDAKVLD